MGERETLIAVSEVIASGEQIIGIEVVVNLGNHAVHAIFERGCCREIIRDTTGIIAYRTRDIRRWPGIARQNSGSHRIRSSNHGQVRSDLVWIRHATCAGLCPGFPLPLVVHVKEGFILHDRPAERAAKLVIQKRVLRIWLEIEIIPGPKLAAAPVFEQ